ncbi:MAG TPA: hypothetical protein VJ227_04875 [Patescibacteria group bacterium]|nr:hypothetical protein [Patescibacteria group bacterium]
MTHPERIEEKLDEISRNPHRCFEEISLAIDKRKERFSLQRGLTSEAIAKFLISSIQEITRIEDCHALIGGLDADLRVHFINMRTINVQVKTADNPRARFLEKISTKNKVLKMNARFVALSAERPFDEIVQDFIDQVNAIEGHVVLRAPKTQKRKSY